MTCLNGQHVSPFALLGSWGIKYSREIFHPKICLVSLSCWHLLVDHKLEKPSPNNSGGGLQVDSLDTSYHSVSENQSWHARSASINEEYLFDEQLAKSIGDKNSGSSKRFINILVF